MELFSLETGIGWTDLGLGGGCTRVSTSQEMLRVPSPAAFVLVHVEGVQTP